MKSRAYQETDIEGRATLEVISEADNFNRWMYDTIRPFCWGNILEVGSGIGNISKFFLHEGFSISLSDIRQNYCDYLKTQFESLPNLVDIINLDLLDPDFDKKFNRFRAGFNTVFSLNVVEHINDDLLAINNASYLLRKGGNLIILVPAYPFLYNNFDKVLGHYRRYTRKTLHNILIKNDFKVVHTQYFNLAGTFGWFVSGKLQKNKTIPGGQMEFYDRLVPLFKMLDKLIWNAAGLSVIAVGRK